MLITVLQKENVLCAVNAVTNWTDRRGDPDFILRFNVSTSFVNSIETPYIHIRKIPKTKITVRRLIEKGVLTDEMAEYLVRQVSADVQDGLVRKKEDPERQQESMHFWI